MVDARDLTGLGVKRKFDSESRLTKRSCIRARMCSCRSSFFSVFSVWKERRSNGGGHARLRRVYRLFLHVFLFVDLSQAHFTLLVLENDFFLVRLNVLLVGGFLLPFDVVEDLVANPLLDQILDGVRSLVGDHRS